MSHGEALHRELESGAEERAFAVQLARDWRALPLDGQEQAMLRYVEQVTVDPGEMGESDVEALLAVGFDDEDILEITVVAAWYNFVSRLACALGIELETEKRGSPVLEGLPWPARVG